jgi:hypothetical protein
MPILKLDVYGLPLMMLRLTGEVKTTYAFSAFLMPFPSNFHFTWYQQAGEGGCYDTLAERYGECIRCFTLTLRLLIDGMAY